MFNTFHLCTIQIIKIAGGIHIYLAIVPSCVYVTMIIGLLQTQIYIQPRTQRGQSRDSQDGDAHAETVIFRSLYPGLLLFNF